MIRTGALLVLLVVLSTACDPNNEPDPTTTTVTTTSVPNTSVPSTDPDTTTSAAPTTSPGLPEVWEDSVCLTRYDPPRAAPPDGYAPHFVCEDDPMRIAPAPRGFRNPGDAIRAVLEGPTEEESAVGFVEVGTVGGFDISEGPDTIEIVLDGPTTPRLVAAVKATVERGTTKEVTVR